MVSVDYRLTPENKFPASWGDALAAYKWAAANAASINGDPQKLALASESAGGNLAMTTAIAARDAGLLFIRSRNLVDARLAGLSPVTIIKASIDPLRDDGAKLEDALKKAGVSVERKLYEGVTHEFFGTAAVVQKAKDAQVYTSQRLRQAFGG